MLFFQQIVEEDSEMFKQLVDAINRWLNQILDICYICDRPWTRKDRLMGRIAHTSVYDTGSHRVCAEVHYFLLGLLLSR